MNKKSILKQQVKKEIQSLYKRQEDIVIDPNISGVWILSGPGNFYKPLDDEKDYQQWMDRHRILYGLLLAREITAARCKKDTKAITLNDLIHDGPLVIYNGVPDENAALKKALLNSPHLYPQGKIVIIEKLVEDRRRRNIANTQDQILSFPIKLLYPVGPIKKKIAIVSHAQHFPRIMRYLKRYKIFPDSLDIEIFGLKPPKEKNKEFSEEEAEKVWEYYKKGDLAWKPLVAKNR